MIPMVDLGAQHAALRSEIEAACGEVLAAGTFIGGEACRAFEKDFAAYCGVRHACGVANGTDALFLALGAVGIGPGDEVVTAPFSFVSTATAITRTGAQVVFADVEDAHLNLDPAEVEKRITERTKALLPVHLFGHPANMDALGEIARRHRLVLMEDAAQAHGARWRKKKVGGWGRAACFSFYPTKNLGANGDAGAVVTDDADLASRVRRLSHLGESDKYIHVVAGINSRLDNLQAAILAVKLKHLDGWNARRRAIAARYREQLAGIPGLRLPEENSLAEPVYHQFTVRTPDRDSLRAHLAREGIASAVHYPRPLHRQPVFEVLQIPEGAYPVAEKAAREVLSLPIYPELNDEQVHRVALAVVQFFEARSA